MEKNKIKNKIWENQYTSTRQNTYI
jgi:hypothetical protein